MASFYSADEGLFIGNAPSGYREDALADAIVAATTFYRTEFIVYETVEVPDLSEINDGSEYVAIRARPKLVPNTRAEEKILQIVSPDPYRSIWFNPSGDIGIPFYRVFDYNAVAIRVDRTTAKFSVLGTVQNLGHIKHKKINQNTYATTAVFAQLLTNTEETVGSRLYIGYFLNNCGTQGNFRFRKNITTENYILAEKVRIDFSDPEEVEVCPG